MKWMILLAFFTAYVAVASCRGFSRRSGRCESSADCAEDECCLARNSLQLIGRGKCRRLSSFGEHCTPEDLAVEAYGGKYVRNCPCRSGLSCENVGRGRQSFLRNRLSQRCVRGTASSTSTTTSTTSTPTTTSTTTTPTTTTASTANPTTSENPSTVDQQG
ncbi:hypothetical protein AVEN_167134-1 [Araneus ventricosus]|uniref:Prokineticin domain-containing protein n=1 Tax=Araneus ventricosus TaxID=182803 RepID=A0A4Y2GBH2_ARAVE|nr:hypothetical protein AVEN_167134-1 [Araneus ventricosus]